MYNNCNVYIFRPSLMSGTNWSQNFKSNYFKKPIVAYYNKVIFTSNHLFEKQNFII